MIGNDSTISVSIEGDCTVGYVYGGGYRGRIGSDTNPINSISINISGGRVLGDVFGGGRGGLDKVCHNADGTFNWGSSHNDTTGFSIVYCKKSRYLYQKEPLSKVMSMVVASRHHILQNTTAWIKLVNQTKRLA